MKIAYLVNQYPTTTHTFIRREILGVEKSGLQVLRITIRRTTADLPTREDREELEKTFAVLDRGVLPLLWDVVLLAFRRPVAWLRAAALAIRLGHRSHRGLLRHIIYFAEACTIARLLERSGVEHLHAHFGTNPGMVALLAHTLDGPPYSITIHGPGEFDSPELLHLREKVARSAFIATISDFAKSQTYRWSHPEDWKKIHVVRCGIDQRFLDNPLVPIPDTPRLVCVGRLGHSKGHALLIQAAARLVQEGLCFEIILIGDGPLRSFCEKLIHEQDLLETLKITGWLDERAVCEEILASRALVLPSFGEGLPVVIMESFALARPVISTRIAGIPELVESGVNGWLINSGNLEELVGAIREALHTPVDRLFNMGKEGRRVVLEKHNSLIEAEKLANLITETRMETTPRRHEP